MEYTLAWVDPGSDKYNFKIEVSHHDDQPLDIQHNNSKKGGWCNGK